MSCVGVTASNLVGAPAHMRQGPQHSIKDLSGHSARARSLSPRAPADKRRSRLQPPCPLSPAVQLLPPPSLSPAVQLLPPAMSYLMTRSGQCAAPITTYEECAAASAALTITQQYEQPAHDYQSSSWQYPSGCYYRNNYRQRVYQRR